jgi:hypothetical protein
MVFAMLAKAWALMNVALNIATPLFSVGAES